MSRWSQFKVKCHGGRTQNAYNAAKYAGKCAMMRLVADALRHNQLLHTASFTKLHRRNK